jgi:hypothetical protein
MVHDQVGIGAPPWSLEASLIRESSSKGRAGRSIETFGWPVVPGSGWVTVRTPCGSFLEAGDIREATARCRPGRIRDPAAGGAPPCVKGAVRGVPHGYPRAARRDPRHRARTSRPRRSETPSMSSADTPDRSGSTRSWRGGRVRSRASSRTSPSLSATRPSRPPTAPRRLGGMERSSPAFAPRRSS